MVKNMTKISNRTPTHVTSWQQYQEMHRSITHKSETFRKIFERPNRYDIEDIEDLHKKIMQLAEPIPTISKTYNITVTYLESAQTVHESFDNFKMNLNTAAATKLITLTYNFLLEHVQTRNAYPYRISVDIISSIAVSAEMGNHSMLPSFIIRDMAKGSGRTEIEYVDYSIAQNFMHTISQWFESRNLSISTPPFTKFLQKKSRPIPFISKNISLFIYAYVAWKFLVFYNLCDSLNHLALFAIFAIPLGIFIQELAERSGYSIRENIDRIGELSYINLTRGDKELFEKFEKNNSKRKRKALIKAARDVLIGILSAAIAKYLLNA